VEARPLPREAPATQAAMVRRARRQEKEMLAGARSDEARMGREGLSLRTAEFVGPGGKVGGGRRCQLGQLSRNPGV